MEDEREQTTSVREQSDRRTGQVPHARQGRRLPRTLRPRLPLRRPNPVGRPYWDPLWPLAIEEAVQSIGAECGAVNGGLLFKTAELRDQVLAMAEEAYPRLRARFRPR